MISFTGYIVPGIYFDSDYCLCVYRWKDSSIQIKQMTEIWIIEPDGKKICYIDTKEGMPFVNTYHSFDEIIDADISVVENHKLIKLSVCKNSNQILQLKINLKMTVANLAANFLLRRNNQKFITEGKTETGKKFINKPQSILKVTNVDTILNGRNIGKIIKPRKTITFGDAIISQKPILVYCTHDLD